jgi:hypothetical protein
VDLGIAVFPSVCPTRGLEVSESEANPKSNLESAFHNGLGQSVVQLTGRSIRPSSRNGGSKGQIVGKSNGEGRGVPVA